MRSGAALASWRPAMRRCLKDDSIRKKNTNANFEWEQAQLSIDKWRLLSKKVSVIFTSVLAGSSNLDEHVLHAASDVVACR